MIKFDTLIEQFKMLLEADLPTVNPAPDMGTAPAATEAPAENPAPEAPAPEPVEKEPTSQARAALIQTAVSAYIEPEPNLSKMLITNADQINIHNADKVLQDIQKRLPPTANRHFNKNFGKGGKGGVEVGEKLELIKLAWKAMFDKSSVEVNPEIASKYKEVTVDNAEDAYKDLSLALSLTSEDYT
jgi:hypothetical protein